MSAITLELHTVVLSLSLLFSLALALILYVKLLLCEIPQARERAGRPLVDDVILAPPRSAALARKPTQVVDEEQQEAGPTISRTFTNAAISR